jgi:hypothetical protein
LQIVIKKEQIFVILSILSIALIVFFSWYSSGTPLNRYIPKNSEEKQIISLIEVFHEARKEFDIESYLACLDPTGSYMFSGHLMVSKDKLAKLLPQFWAGLESSSTRANNAHIMPISRENLNGNFFDGELYNPIIEIEDGNARVAVRFQTPIVRWRSHLFITLIKTNGVWLINRYEWAIG